MCNFCRTDSDSHDLNTSLENDLESDAFIGRFSFCAAYGFRCCCCRCCCCALFRSFRLSFEYHCNNENEIFSRRLLSWRPIVVFGLFRQFELQFIALQCVEYVLSRDWIDLMYVRWNMGTFVNVRQSVSQLFRTWISFHSVNE